MSGDRPDEQRRAVVVSLDDARARALARAKRRHPTSATAPAPPPTGGDAA